MSRNFTNVVAGWARALRDLTGLLVQVAGPVLRFMLARAAALVASMVAAVVAVPGHVAAYIAKERAAASDPRPPEEREWSPFLYRDFTLAILSRLCFWLGTSVQSVAVAWLVYSSTGDPLLLGYLGVAGFLPVVALLLVTGYVADRFERRIVMALATLLMGVSSLGMMINAWDGKPTIWIVYVLVVCYAAGRAFYQPASQALIPDLVGPRHISNAIATGSALQQVATISGPAIGGLLYWIDGRLPFIMTTVAFTLCALLLMLIRSRPAASKREPTTWTSLLAGLRYAIDRRIVLAAISLDMFAVLLGGAIAILPIYVHDVLEMGPKELGILRSAPAIGALVMASVFSSKTSVRSSGLVLLIAVGVYGLATIGFGLSGFFLMSFAFLALVGASDMVSVVIRMTIVQVETPPELRGRVAAVNSLFISTANEIGQLQAGFMVWLIGTIPAIVVGGVGAIGIALLWARLFPELRDRDHLVPEQTKPG